MGTSAWDTDSISPAGVVLLFGDAEAHITGLESITLRVTEGLLERHLPKGPEKGLFFISNYTGTMLKPPIKHCKIAARLVY
jgi:hypothetical protein